MCGSSSHPILQASEQGPQACLGHKNIPRTVRYAVQRFLALMTKGKYIAELFKEGGEGAAVERVLASKRGLIGQRPHHAL